MYSVLIELKDSIPDEILEQLKVIIESAFVNRVGKAENSCTERGKFEFTGGEEAYECLQLGLIILDDYALFWQWVAAWDWIDHEEPWENCSVLEAFSKVR